MPGPLGSPAGDGQSGRVGVQPDALQATAGQQGCDAVGALVCDRDQHPGVRPESAWQDESTGEHSCEGDHDRRRRRLHRNRPLPHLGRRGPPSSMNGRAWQQAVTLGSRGCSCCDTSSETAAPQQPAGST